jgi:FeS assembly SUF system protein
MMDAATGTFEARSLIAAEETSACGAGGGLLMNEIIAALRTVHDPEIPLNIFDLGLIYHIDVKDPGLVEIGMTLTAPGCPVASEILGWVKTAVNRVEGVTETKVNLVFDPPWDQSRMSEEARLELGLE